MVAGRVTSLSTSDRRWCSKACIMRGASTQLLIERRAFAGYTCHPEFIAGTVGVIRRLKKGLTITTYAPYPCGKTMAGAAGLEPATLGFGDRCSTN